MQCDEPALSALVLINGYAVWMEALYKQNAIHIFFFRSSHAKKAGRVLTHPVDILIVVERGARKRPETRLFGP